MPQFEVANFIPQLFWLAIFFAILYFGVVRLTVPKVGAVMTERETQVKGDLDTAERAKRDAERLRTDYDEGIADAHASARARVADAKARAAAALEAQLKASNEAIEAQAARSQSSIEAALANARTEIESVTAEAAGAIVEKLTGARPAEAAVADATRAALSA